LAAPAGAAADVAPWFSPDWTVRRVVDAKPVDAASKSAGSEVAACGFFSGGLAKPDGGDIRVAARGRQLTGHKILQVGPADFYRVAFALVAGETRYFIYYGNPKADAPAAWEPQRGLLLEVRRWLGGPPPDRIETVQAVWTKAPRLGADFVSHVSFGFNPFADSDTPSIFHFTGWFVPPVAGKYTVATSSTGGSWVLVDGQPVVAWPGQHGPSGDARHAKEVTLTPGVHRLDYWNVNPGGSPTMVAAWEQPQTGRFAPIPAKAFLPVAEAALVETDMPGEKLVADFHADNAAETWWPDQYAVRIRFRNITKGVNPQSGPKAEWDFGDGQTSTVPSPTHIYLAPGEYAVALKVSRIADSNTFRTKVSVQRNWWKQTDQALDPAKKYAEEVAAYNFATLDTRSLTAAVSLMDHEEMSKGVVAAASELLKRQGFGDAQAHRFGMVLGEHLLKLGRFPDAVAAYRQVEDRIKSAPQKAETASHIIAVLLGDLRRYDDAEKECQRILKTYATAGADAALRRAHIGLADIWRHRGDGDKARKEYKAAADIKVVSYPPNEAAVRIGTLARNVEEYTRQKEWQWAFKFIDDWAWEFPQDKLLGNWSFLRAAGLAAKDDKAGALQEAMDLLGANPSSAYAVRLLMLAAECQVALGDKDKARLLLQSAVDDYPEDPDQAKARSRLMALGGPVKTENEPKSAPKGPTRPEAGREPKP
jgi:TolA-binding protein